ncbi:hypothetical protein Pmar_PMAR007877 [Perkinsus marinus ATCC 50983]|uniref:Uncharacterized protein n=1 Tax=Perkinsus marinus (strain ATCC 50983 / TXsc) TaxID=423536 RepID=C5K974_PERM5|nr:hypothetical protein Pmar_PMAR007877 [Perkinsus marinus ATCC 50983]EER18980.1 hypothetical protein Pmar_PMAR007877 [Perkinsus marinus ATCC 50983]|eukprot:XP_002787184.1 hypothetical protein Pmar_PMAR007877 [Perkinsus marinus ATCC 50983]
MAEEKMLAVGDGPLHLSEHLYQSIPNYQLIDALPFIDPFGQEDFARVEEMIQKEIATFQPARNRPNMTVSTQHVSIVDTAENNEYLDVATKYSVPQWIHGKLQVSAFEQSLVKKRKALAKEVEDIQKRRKLDQMSHGNVLRSLHREEVEFETNNFETECATMAMEADLRRLRQVIDSDPQRKAEVPVNLVEALSEVLDGAKPTAQENASSTV